MMHPPRLIGLGLTLEAEFVDLPEVAGTQPISRLVYYLRDSQGMRIEVVDASRRAHLQAWLNGEDYPAA